MMCFFLSAATIRLHSSKHPIHDKSMGGIVVGSKAICAQALGVVPQGRAGMARDGSGGPGANNQPRPLPSQPASMCGEAPSATGGSKQGEYTDLVKLPLPLLPTRQRLVGHFKAR